MKIISIIFLILISTANSCEQENTNSAERLKALFRNSVQKEDIVNNYVHPWRSNNDDSLYFKSDTINVYQFKTRSYESFGCEKVNWNFSSENEFVLTRVHLCKEPPTRDISKPNDSLKVKFKNKRSMLIIEFNHLNKNIDKFELIDFKENDTIRNLKLKRMHG